VVCWLRQQFVLHNAELASNRGGGASDLAQAEREGAVLESVGGLAAPELYDFRRTSDWFDTPAMCMQFLPGRQQDLRTVGLAEIGQLASLVARVHECPVDGLGASMGKMTTVASYAGDRLRAILSTLVWVGRNDYLPVGVRRRVEALALVVKLPDQLADTVQAPGAQGRHVDGQLARDKFQHVAPAVILSQRAGRSREPGGVKMRQQCLDSRSLRARWLADSPANADNSTEYVPAIKNVLFLRPHTDHCDG
jgi:hypothetical protein